jgi:hypothetical protein
VQGFKYSSFCLVAIGILLAHSGPALAQNEPPAPSSPTVSSPAGNTPQAAAPNPGPAFLAVNTPSGNTPQGTALVPEPSSAAINTPGGNTTTPSSVTLIVPRLQSPAGLTFQAGRDKVLLAWTRVPGATAYQVLRADRRPDPAGPWPLPVNLSPITEEYYLDIAQASRTPPMPNATYFYAVMALDAAGNSSAPSAVLEVLNSGTLCAPMGLEAVSGDGKVTLTWQLPFCIGESPLAGYLIYRSLRPGELGEPVVSSPWAGTTFTDTGGPGAPLQNGTDYYYSLVSQDQAGTRSPPTEQVAALPHAPPTPPSDLIAMGKSDDVIELLWQPSKLGTFPVTGYNVYRCVTPTAWEGPINRQLVTETAYLDSTTNSTSKPILGQTYEYRIRAVDARNNESPDSGTAKAAPKPPIEIPNTGILSTAIPGLPPESSLTISGRKKIDLGYTEVFPLNVKDGNTDRGLSTSSALKKGFNLAQELQVKLQGKVGKKIAVDVDYDDRLEEQRKISIIYAGDPNEVVQEAAFGDIRLDLPQTQFAGYNKELFGAKLRVGLDRFRFTAIGAQTKGVTVTETFKGNASPRTVEISDLNFETYRYYYLTYDPLQVNHPDLPNSITAQAIHGLVPGSVSVWVTDGRITADTQRITRTTPSPRTWAFNRLSPGLDFTVDFDRGILSLATPIQSSWAMVVAYRYTDAAGAVHSVGYTPAGDVDFTPTTLVLPYNPADPADPAYVNDPGFRSLRNDAHLLQDFDPTTGTNDLRMMLMNRYSLGYQNIFNPQLDPDFKIKIFTTSGEERVIPQPSDPQGAAEIYTILPGFGSINFRHFYPFQEGSLYTSDTYNPNLKDCYNRLYNPRLGSAVLTAQSQYRIHVEFKNQISNFQLAHFNVIKNSEVIKKDGARLRRDADYYIDYDTGYITFTNPDIIASSTDITVSYEFLPFGGKFQSNLFGARGEFDVVPSKLTLGSTFLYNASQSPQDIPDIRSSPTSLSLLDGDARLSLNPDDFSSFLGGSRVPLSVDASVEGAYSTYAVNTYRRAGENGVALLDNFEGSDNVLALPTDNNSWFPSGAPVQLTDPAARRFVARTDAYETGRVPVDSNDKKHQLRLNYSDLRDGTWDGLVYSLATSGTNLHDYRFIEMSVYSAADSAHPVRVNLDVGIVSENSNGNSTVGPDVEGDGLTPLSGYDVGIVNVVVFENNQRTWARRPDGPDGRPPQFGVYPQDLVRWPGAGAPPGYWGEGNGRLDSEDLDRNDHLDTSESFYEYTVTLSPGWNYIKVPLTQFTGRLGDNPPTDNVLDPKFLSYVKHVRLWVNGVTAEGTDGYVQFESLQFTGNKWQAQSAPGSKDPVGNPLVEPDPNKFNATTVSLETDPNYKPNTNFFIYDQNNSAEELKNERSLQLTYALSRYDVVDPNVTSLAGQSVYYLSRQLSTGTGFNYSDYRYLRVDVFKKTPTAFGEALFIRLGPDVNNYYQYTLPLDGVPVGTWHTLTVRLDGSDRNRLAHFQPLVIPGLNQVKEIDIGVLNPNATAQTEVLWLNNLRVTDGQARMGGALRLSSSSKFSDLVTVGTELRDVDSDFMTIDEAPSGKQHVQNSSALASVTALPFLPINAAWRRDANYTEPEHRSDPVYSNNFSTPDTATEVIGGGANFTSVPGLDVLYAIQRLDRNTEYLQDNYKNSRENTLTQNPQVSYSLPPTLFTVPLGSTTFSGNFNFQDLHLVYDQIGTSPTASTTYYDKWTHTRTENYAYRGNYQPVEYLSLVPGFTYNQVSARGYLTYLSFYAELNPIQNPENDQFFSETYRTIRIDRNLSLTAKLLKLPVLRDPTLGYQMTLSRDYSNDTFIPNGSMDLSVALAPGDAFGWPQFPLFNLSRRYLESAAFEHLPYVAEDPISGMDPRRMWLFDLAHFEGPDPEYLDKAKANSKSYTDNVGSLFTLSADLNLSPRYEYAWKRLGTQNNFTVSKYLSLGSRLEWSRVPYLADLISLTTMSLDYNYRRNQNIDASNTETLRTTGHTLTVTLPSRFTPDLNGSFILGYSSILNQSGADLSTLYYQNQYTGEFDLGYNLLMLNPIRLPGFWPFNGALVKIEQMLRFENTLRAEWTRNRAVNLYGQDLESDLYRNETRVNYSLWRNVLGELRLSNEWFYSRLQDNKDYYAISFSLGLTATF